MYQIFKRSRALSRGRPSHRALLSLLLGATVSLGRAAETPPFATLLQQAQINAPQLLEQAANVRAAAEDARQARAWINPTLSATAENIGAPKSGGVSQRQDTYAITQVFETGGKRSARIEAEQRKSSAVGARGCQARVAFANELTVAYATAEAMQHGSRQLSWPAKIVDANHSCKFEIIIS
jgi:cobalt-zinc-cadmium efflux system outer membrane protein